MRKLAIIDTDEKNVVQRVEAVYFEVEPQAFEKMWEDGQKSMNDWAELTKRINYGVISYLHSIGALWMDEDGQFKVDFADFTASSFIDGLLSNEHYLPDEVTEHTVYFILKKAVNAVKKMFPKGRMLPIDIGRGLQYLGPLLPEYVAYSRKDPEISRLFDTLLPELETFLKPLTKKDHVSGTE